MTEGHDRGTPAYRRLLAALFCAGIATFAQLYSPQGVLPQIAAQFRVDAATAALTISASTIGLALAVLPWSFLSDRVGRLRAMTISIAGATLVGAVVPFIPVLGVLVAARFVEGALLGGVPALAVAYLSEQVSAAASAAAAGTYVAGTTVGGLLGRAVPPIVADALGWRPGVLVALGLAVAGAVLFVALAPRGSTVPASPPAPVAARILENLRSPVQWTLYAQAFLLMGGFVALYNYLGFRLRADPFDVPPALAGLLFTAYLAGTWSSAQAGALATRLGRRRVLLGSIALMAAGVALTLPDSLPSVIVGLVVLTAGFFAAHSVASGWTPVTAPGGRAQASSLYTLAYYAGSSLVGYLGGLVFTASGWTALAVGVLVLEAIALVSAAAVLRRAESAIVR